MKEELYEKLKCLDIQISNLEKLLEVNHSRLLEEFLKSRKRVYKKLLIEYKRIINKERFINNIKRKLHSQKEEIKFKKILQK